MISETMSRVSKCLPQPRVSKCLLCKIEVNAAVIHCFTVRLKTRSETTSSLSRRRSRRFGTRKTTGHKSGVVSVRPRSSSSHRSGRQVGRTPCLAASVPSQVIHPPELPEAKSEWIFAYFSPGTVGVRAPRGRRWRAPGPTELVRFGSERRSNEDRVMAVSEVTG